MNIESVKGLLIRLKFDKLALFRAISELGSHWTSPIWFNSWVLLSFCCWSLTLFNLHIGSRLRFYFPDSNLSLVIHVTCVFQRSFCLSKSFPWLGTPIFNHFNSLFHLLNRSVCFDFHLHLGLICDSDVVITTVWRFLFRFEFLCPVVFCTTVFDILTFAFFSNSLKCCGFWVNFDFFVLSLLRLIVIRRDCLLSCRLTPSSWLCVNLLLSSRRIWLSLLRQPSIYFLDHYHFFFQSYQIIFTLQKFLSF